ncbi:MAG: AAA family ATPase [Acidimicrobiia bacterium]|nr:AAA family ATPase [Acidimicrobiia bacterium]
MRIHRIRLRNYRGIGDREVEFATTGVTIVEGGNEVGKSSLAEAIDLLFEERDDTTKSRVRSVKPVGQDVGAEIEAEVTAGEYHFVYSKRWHRDRFTRLEIIEPRREQIEGRPAHDRVREILDATVDDSLWRALRVDQNAAHKQPAWGTDSSLARALDIAAGGSEATAQDGDLFARVRDERDRYWTAATSRPNAGRLAVERECTEARHEVEEVTAALKALEADVDLHGRLTHEVEDLREQLASITEDRDRLVEELSTVEKREAEIERLGSEAEVAAGVLERSQDASAARCDLVRDVDQRRVAQEEIEGERLRSDPALEAARRGVEVAESKLRAAQQSLGAARVASERAAADHQHLRDRFDLETLTERHGHAAEAEGDIATADELLATSKVDDGALDAIEAAHTRVTTLRASLDASSVVVRTEALRDISLQVGDEVVSLRGGEADERQVSGEMELLVGDHARMVVVPGGDARALGLQLATARDELDRLCRSVGVDDVASARRSHQARQMAKQARDAAMQRRSQSLRDLTLDEMVGKIERLEAAIASYEGSLDAGSSLPADLSSAHRLADDAASDLHDAEEVVRGCDEHLRMTRDQCQDLLLNRSSLDERLRSSAEELYKVAQRLEAARAEESDEGLEERVAAARTVSEAASEALRSATEALAKDDPESLRLRCENAKLAVARTASEIRDRENDLSGAQARLEVRGEDGLQHDLDEASTRLAHARSALERLEARADAALLLHTTMTRHRDAARRRYVAPFRERIEGLARVVFGPGLEVELDEDLQIVRRTLDGKTIDWDDLSNGAKEQLAVVARLACAAMVSDDGGVPVIFDDALGNTDTPRLERMGAVLAAACGDSQVIVLTCMPDRYRNVGSARVVRVTP